jgi:hypothetical protein
VGGVGVIGKINEGKVWVVIPTRGSEIDGGKLDNMCERE